MDGFEFKHILVMGAGGVGGYFGGKLAQGSGGRISLVARGEHLKAIRTHGLRIKSFEGDFVVKGPASENPASLPPPDLVLFAVKSYDTEQAIRQIAGAATENTQILPLQNGIENMPKLIRAFGKDRVIPALCRIGIRISEPGVLSHTHPGSIIIGDREGGSIGGLAEAFGRAGVTCRVSKNITRDIWIKFAWNAIFNMLTAAENRTTDYFFPNGTPDDRLWKLAGEVLSVARAEGVNLRKKDIEKMFGRTARQGAFLTSTLHDRRVGKKLEFDAFTGAILRLGKKHGLHLPEYETLHQKLSETEPV